MSDKKTKKSIKIAIYALCFVAVIGLYQFLPMDEWTRGFREWVDGLGAAGWIVTIVVYALATVALAPGSVLTLAAGLAFGLWAFPLVVIGATLGAGGAFLCGRYLVRDKVQVLINERPKFKAIDTAIKDEGWKVVGLMRLSPAVPFNLQNWLFGATSVGFWPYWIATFFGIMPGTLLYVWIGSLGGGAASGADPSSAKFVLLAAGLIATVAVTVLIGKKAKAKLDAYA